jgi:hypothetical protein
MVRIFHLFQLSNLTLVPEKSANLICTELPPLPQGLQGVSTVTYENDDVSLIFQSLGFFSSA